MKHIIIPSLLLTGSLLFAKEPQTESPSSDSTKQELNQVLDLRYRDPKGVGYDHGYASIDYFLTYAPTCLGGNPELLFNIRGHVFNDGHIAGNVGLGYRQSIKQDRYVLGANLFYDFRTSSNLFSNQTGLGLEFLSHHLDIRLNGYMPVGKKNEFKTKVFEQFSESNILIQEKILTSLPCTEIEFGAAPTSNFYIAAGSYYLFRPASKGMDLGNVFGAKGRVSVDVGRYMTLGGLITYDPIFKTRAQGLVSFHIPLGPHHKQKESGRALRQLQIVRNEIIPFQEKKKLKLLSLGEDENDLVHILFVNNTAPDGGTGSFLAPFASFKAAEAHSEPGDVIYVFPGDKTPRNMEEGIQLKENQVLASSGAPLTLEDVVIPPMTPGENPVITNIHPQQPVVANPGVSQLENFHIIQPWEYFFGNWDFGHDLGSGGDHHFDFEGVHVASSNTAAPPGSDNDGDVDDVMSISGASDLSAEDLADFDLDAVDQALDLSGTDGAVSLDAGGINAVDGHVPSAGDGQGSGHGSDLDWEIEDGSGIDSDYDLAD